MLGVWINWSGSIKAQSSIDKVLADPEVRIEQIFVISSLYINRTVQFSNFDLSDILINNADMRSKGLT